MTGVALLFLAVAGRWAWPCSRSRGAPSAGSSPVPRRFRAGSAGISVLKPLRGIDDDLEANLASFADQDWPVFEVLLGLHDDADPAASMAHAAAARWPGRFRVVIQGPELGMNPKVSQLAALVAAARHELLVISDSNVRVEPGYLAEIAARLEDPEVGLVTHLIAGVGERSEGALLENLHLAGGVATGIAAAKAIAGRDVVMGKSMALRREDLDAMGGLRAGQGPARRGLRHRPDGPEAARQAGGAGVAAGAERGPGPDRGPVLPPRPALGGPAARARRPVALRRPGHPQSGALRHRWR